MTPSFNPNPLFEDDGNPKEVQPYVFPPIAEIKEAHRGTSASRENPAWNAPDRPQNNPTPSKAQAVFTLEQTRRLKGRPWNVALRKENAGRARSSRNYGRPNVPA